MAKENSVPMRVDKEFKEYVDNKFGEIGIKHPTATKMITKKLKEMEIRLGELNIKF